MIPQRAKFTSLRADLRYSPPGGSGLWKAAQLSGCGRFRASVVAGVSMDEVAGRLYGAASQLGQSPFAHVRGRVVERTLLADDGRRLREVAGRAGVTAKSLPMVRISGANAVADTSEQLVDGQPVLLVEPAFRLSVRRVGITVRPDVLVVPGARARDRSAVVGEIKSLRDRGPLTHVPKLDSALGQLAAGREALAQSGLPGRSVSREGLLIQPGTAAGIGARRVPLERWRQGLRVLLPRLGRTVVDLERVESAGGTLADRVVWDSIPRQWSSSCPALCPLAQVCRRELAEAGDVSVLAPELAASTHGAGLSEVTSWIHGMSEPLDAQRRDLAGLLHAAVPESSLSDGAGGGA